MKLIANILTEGSFQNNELYNVVSNKDDLISELPTLVIGWSFTKRNYPEANIINWQINENTFWCFGKREKRNRYEEAIEKFMDYSLSHLIDSIEYNFFSILTAEVSERRSLANAIKNNTIYVYINNDIVYLNKENSKKIIGISLRDIDYLGKSRQKFYDLLKGENIIKTNDIFNKSSFATKMALKNKSYAIPYLFS